MEQIDPILGRYRESYEKHPDSKVDPNATLEKPWVVCTRADHQRLDDWKGEWKVDHPRGKVVDDVKRSVWVSKYNNKRTLEQRQNKKEPIKWKCSFDYDTTGCENGKTKAQAYNDAEDHLFKMNVEHNVGTNVWRYVHPIHVEIKFGERTAIVERKWWQARKDNYIAKLRHHKHLHLKLTDISDETRDLRLDHVIALGSINNTNKKMKTRVVDGDHRHLCPTNLRTILEHHDTVLWGDRHDDVWAVKRTLEQGNPHKYFRLHAYRYYIIPDTANPNEVPDYVSSTPHDTISWVRHNGYLYWHTVYNELHKNLPGGFDDTTPIPRAVWNAEQKLKNNMRLGRRRIVEPEPAPKKRKIPEIRHSQKLWDKYPDTDGWANPIDPVTGYRTRPKSTRPPSRNMQTKSWRRANGLID